MPLIWTDPAPGKEGVSHYDHVIAETPLGNIMLEWKSWKDHDDPSGHMPWDEFIVESTLEGAKAAVQDAWDRMAPKIVALSTVGDSVSPCFGESGVIGMGGSGGIPEWHTGGAGKASFGSTTIGTSGGAKREGNKVVESKEASDE